MSTATQAKSKFQCLECGATPGKHGRGGSEKCINYDPAYRVCGGLICECPSEGDEGHGVTFEDPCTLANCYHCGWGGELPVKPKKLQPWEKKAVAAGWTPPKNRMAR